MGYGYGPPPQQPQQYQGYPMQAYGPAGMQVWTCRACGLQGQAMVREKISTAGWVVFGILRERVAVCPRCGVNA